jgi:hypothetical protein
VKQLLCLILLAGAGCEDSSLFTAGRDLDVCDGAFPSCLGSAHCVLDTDHYIAGNFPGGQRFIVRSEGGVTLLFQLLITNQQAPGTELRLTVYEPGCGDNRLYDTAGRDLFRVIGSDGVLQIPIQVAQPGDHLVELTSDAFCSWALIWDEESPQTSGLTRPTPPGGNLPSLESRPPTDTSLATPFAPLREIAP